ncbi:MAG TPA: hypothetical protein VL418_17880 [Devosiaceae bacterium]|nr:hypothetical protein [Devosiaceae bacterium]
MAGYRLLLAQGKQIVFEDSKDFAEVWKDISSKELLEFDAELIDGDDRYMGHVAIQRQYVIALFQEWHRSRTGR